VIHALAKGGLVDFSMVIHFLLDMCSWPLWWWHGVINIHELWGKKKKKKMEKPENCAIHWAVTFPKVYQWNKMKKF
jgi:hypothetical protein